MIWRKWARSISNSVLASGVRSRTRLRRPESIFTSPLNSPRLSKRRRDSPTAETASSSRLPLKDHEDAAMRVSLLHHNFAGLRSAFAPKRSQPRNLRVVQLGEHEVSGIGSVGHNEPRAASFYFKRRLGGAGAPLSQGFAEITLNRGM